MEKYRLMNDGYIQRQSDLALIPSNEINTDYKQYLEDIKNGAEVLNFDYKAEEARQLEAERLNGYKRNRAAEYPDFKEYLDGIVKGDVTQVQKYIDDCLAVKAKYPKPASTPIYE